MYPCKDCEQSFSSAEDFSDHFHRESRTSQRIVGCKTKKELEAERKANALD